MQRASYKRAVELVALNDSPGDTDSFELEAVAELMSVGFMADLFGVSVYRFARDVIRLRIKEYGQEAHGQVCRTEPCHTCHLRDAYAKVKERPKIHALTALAVARGQRACGVPELLRPVAREAQAAITKARGES